MKKSLIAAFVFASASMAGGAAFAQTGGGGATVGNTPQTIALTQGAGFFGDVFAANNMGSAFSDRFDFTVAGTGTGGAGGGAGMGSLDAIVYSISRSADTGLDFTSLNLYMADGTLVSTGGALQSGPIDVFTVHGDNLSAGNYYLQVSGNILGASASSFGGAVSMAAPVPEPEAYGMTLAGLGVLGLLARRRRTVGRA